MARLIFLATFENASHDGTLVTPIVTRFVLVSIEDEMRCECALS